MGSVTKAIRLLGGPRGLRHFSVSVLRNSESNVEVSVENGVRTIKLNRPAAKNALTNQMYLQVTNALKESNSDDSTVINVLSSTGDFFCSGNDMKSFRDLTLETDIQKKKAWQRNFEDFVGSFIDCQKPILALVNGPAVGIGATALGLVDLVYVVEKAYFVTPFSQLGICPEACSSYTFPRIMGYGKAHHMLTFGQRITAAEAKACGLVEEVFSADTFHTETSKRVAAYAQLPVKSLVYSKQLVRSRERDILHAVNKAEGAANVALRDTPFHKEAVLSFFNRSKK